MSSPQGLERFLLLYESEAACISRLIASGLSAEVADEIAIYLSQATDLAQHEAALTDAFERRGVRIQFADVSRPQDWVDWLCEAPATTMVWTMTDGLRYYRGSSAPSFARMAGARIFGSTPQAYALAQDKYKTGVLAERFGARIPRTALLANGIPLTPLSEFEREPGGALFVKPNNLGGKLGIWADSRCTGLEPARALSRRIHERFGDDAVIQDYIPGRDVRVSYMALSPDPELVRLGIFAVTDVENAEVGGEFITFRDNHSFSATGDAAGSATLYQRGEREFVPRMQDLRPLAAGDAVLAGQIDEVHRVARSVVRGFGLAGYFSFDFRFAASGEAYLLELEVCPSVSTTGFRTYLETEWGCDTAEAVATAAGVVFVAPDASGY